jgi:hypothetical protein
MHAFTRHKKFAPAQRPMTGRSVGVVRRDDRDGKEAAREVSTEAAIWRFDLPNAGGMMKLAWTAPAFGASDQARP